MAQMLQCLVCITIIVTLVSSSTQRSYQYRINANDASPEDIQSRYLHHENRIAKPVNQSIWSRETRSHRVENSIQMTQNGTTLNRLQVNKTGALKGKYDEIYDILYKLRDEIVYPVQTSEVFANQHLIIPEHCIERGFCEDVPNYPNKRMEEVVAGLGDAVKYFNWEPLVKEDVQDTDNDEKKLCASIQKTVYLQSAPDRNGTWHAVINPKNNLVQRYRVEMCKSSGSECFTLEKMPPGYRTSCSQKHVLRMVEVLINNVVTQVPLKLPSCCSCVIKVLN